MRRVPDNLFRIFLFLLPFQTAYLLRVPTIGGEKWQYGTIGIYLSSLVLACAVMTEAFSRVASFGSVPMTHRIRSAWRDRKGDVFLLAFVLWAGLSALWAQDPALAVYGFLSLLLAADALIMARDMVRRGLGTGLVLVLIMAAVLQAAIGIGQFIMQETFSSTFLGTASHPVWEAGTSVLKNDSGRWLRAYGTFPHPNIFGLFLSIGLFLVIRRIVETGKRAGTDKSWKRAVCFAIVPVLVLGLLVSFSRIAWIGFALGFAVWAAYTYFGNRTRDARRYLVAVSLAVSVSAFVFGFVLRDTVFPRFDRVIVTQEGSVTDRLTTYRDAFRVIRESPILGSGMWNSTAELLRLDPGRPVWDIQPAHDVPLLVLTDLGAIGLLLLAGVIVSSIVRAFQQKNIAMVAMLFLFLPSFFLDHFLWDSVSGALLLFAVFGAFRNDGINT